MQQQSMTTAELHRLRDDLQALLATGATTAEIDDWADAYAFTRADLIDLMRLMATAPTDGTT